MNVKKTNREEIRENTLCVPMNKEEKEKVRKAAEKMGVPMSSFVRIILKDFLKETN